MLSGKRLLKTIAPYTVKWAALAHPYRLAILYLLGHDELWMKDLVLRLNLKQNLLAHHLKILQQAGWIIKAKEGSHSLYRLNAKEVKNLPPVIKETPLAEDLL